MMKEKIECCQTKTASPLNECEKAVYCLCNGRNGEIRTLDLTHPKGARYRAAPRPEYFTRVIIAQSILALQPTMHDNAMQSPLLI
jgi:hypothetical protein